MYWCLVDPLSRLIDVGMMFQVQNLRKQNLPISRIDRPNSLVELKQSVSYLLLTLTVLISL